MNDSQQLDEISRKLDELVSRVDKMHTAVFGIDGQGGLHRWVQDHEKRITESSAVIAALSGVSDKLNEHSDKIEVLEQHKNKLAGIMVVVTAILSLIGAKVLSLLSSK